jgi:hypothetical protein
VLACIIQGLIPASVHADAPSEIAKCTAIADSAERLKCFDAAAGTQRFGLPPPRAPVTKIEDFGKPPPPPAPKPEVTQISATVLEFARTPRGRAVFVLDNGQTWRQLDADGTQVHEPPPDKAIKVTIERGLLGSYNLTIEGRNALIKVRRLK